MAGAFGADRVLNLMAWDLEHMRCLDAQCRLQQLSLAKQTLLPDMRIEKDTLDQLEEARRHDTAAR